MPISYDPNVQTVRDLLPVHEHPPVRAIRAIFRIARAQMRSMHTEYKDSNVKARLIRANLTAEQLYIYEWIGYIFTILAVPTEIFARQCGVSVQTLKHWLKRKGHLPAITHFRRLCAIYDANFCDKLAAEYLHGAKIGQWRAKRELPDVILRRDWEKRKNNDETVTVPARRRG